MKFRFSYIPAVLCLAAVAIDAQMQQRRSRGEGLYACESANTVGSENVWASGRAIGFLWDNDPTTDKSKLLAFLEATGEVGLFDISSVAVEARLISYPWDGKPQFGYVGGALKLTLPNNRDLRFAGPGILFRYRHTLTKEIPSIAGYRQDGTANGFSAEGFMNGGGTVELKAMFDLDVLAKLSFMPIKVMANTGLRIPTDKTLRPFTQYLMSAGIAYVGLGFDAFVEYSFEGFVNKGPKPKRFDQELGSRRTWEVAFTENPMYLSVGGRVRYERGLVLYACVPLLVSTNQGSEITDVQVGGVDAFDPWYAKWKLVGGMSFPLKFSQTGSEMRRNFLLMKNRKEKIKIDIDEKLDALEGPGKTKELSEEERKQREEEENRRRMEEIRKRREEIQKAQ